MKSKCIEIQKVYNRANNYSIRYISNSTPNYYTKATSLCRKVQDFEEKTSPRKLRARIEASSGSFLGPPECDLLPFV